MKTVVSLLLALLLAVPVAGQSTQGPTAVSALDASGVCTTANACAEFAFGGTVSLGLDITGTFTGTLTFETGMVNGTWRVQTVINANTLATAGTATAPGSFTVPNVGFKYVRVRATAWSSGTATISSRQGYAKLSPADGGTFAGATFTGPGLFPDGTVALPGIAFAAEPSSGWYRASAGVVNLSVLGVNRFITGATYTSLAGPNGGAYFSVANGEVIVNSANLTMASGGTPRIVTNTAANKQLSTLDGAALTGRELTLGTPTLGTCTGGTLVSGSHNFAGEITGNTSGSCILTFGTPAWTNTPFCFAMSRTSTTHPRISAASSAAITITGGVSGEAIGFHCEGRIGV